MRLVFDDSTIDGRWLRRMTRVSFGMVEKKKRFSVATRDGIPEIVESNGNGPPSRFMIAKRNLKLEAATI